jgi:histone H3
VPGRNLCGFLTPPVVAGAVLRAARFVANCLRGAFPPVDLRAVCFVRAILNIFTYFQKYCNTVIEIKI